MGFVISVEKGNGFLEKFLFDIFDRIRNCIDIEFLGSSA